MCVQSFSVQIITPVTSCASRILGCHRAAFPVTGSFENSPEQWLTEVLGRAHTVR